MGVALKVMNINGGHVAEASPTAEHHVYISGLSAEMQPVQRLICEIAPTDIPILLLGESGTGKEVAALQIHDLSKYRNLPFLKLSCVGLSPEEVDARASEKGDAKGTRTSPGTLFLDELSELDANCQRRLLHAISDADGVGVNQPLAGRIVSSTTRDMNSEVQGGRFRSELFYRLNGVCLQLPPLRQRRQDIPLLVQHFLSKYARIFQRSQMELSDQAVQFLVEYSWPGNIRELENVVKRIVALENEELGLADLKASPATHSSRAAITSPSLKAASRAASRQAERELILQALEKTRWNRKRAAEALQISYKSLLFKLKQIQVPESGEA